MGLAALISLAGLTGFVIVMVKGVLDSGSPAEHTASYTAGWSLFFFLFLGLPCLGAIPWCRWLRKRSRHGRD